MGARPVAPPRVWRIPHPPRGGGLHVRASHQAGVLDGTKAGERCREDNDAMAADLVDARREPLYRPPSRQRALTRDAGDAAMHLRDWAQTDEDTLPDICRRR